MHSAAFTLLQVPPGITDFAGPRLASSSSSNIALALSFQGKLAEAEKLQREALALQIKFLGSNHLDVATSLHNLASALSAQRKYSDAEPSFRQALAIFLKSYGEEHPDREYLQLHARSTGTNDWPTANVKSHLGFALTLAAWDAALTPTQRDEAFAEAEALLLAAQKRLQTSTSAKLEFKRKAIIYLVRLYEAWGKQERAAQWKAALGDRGGTQWSSNPQPRTDSIPRSPPPPSLLSRFYSEDWRASATPLA